MPANAVWPWIEGEEDVEGAARNCLEAYDQYDGHKSDHRLTVSLPALSV